MARYTEKLLATLRNRYENTDQTILSIAAEFDIGSRNLQRLVTKHRWAKRSKRVRDVPRAQRLLEEAKALAADLPPPERGRSDCQRVRPAWAGPMTDSAVRVGVPREETPTPTLPLSGEGSLSAIDRIEALVAKEIEAEETVRKLFRGKRRVATTSERNARTLATLTQTLHALQRLRAGSLPEQETLTDDDTPHDIDEFRRDLARRIDAFVASRTDAGDADGNSGVTPVDAAG